MLQIVLKPRDLDVSIQTPDVLSPLHIDDDEKADESNNNHEDVDDMTLKQLLDRGLHERLYPESSTETPSWRIQLLERTDDSWLYQR